MAGFTTISGKLTFRMDTGEVKGGKAVYRNAHLGNIAASPAADDVAAVCGRIASLLQYATEQVTLTRVDAVEL